jgi:tRNA(Ile)-lysidine synthase
MPRLAGLGLDAARIAQLARRTAEAEAAIGQWAERVTRESVGLDPVGALSIPAATLAHLPDAVGIGLLRRLVDHAGGHAGAALEDPERLHAELGNDAFRRQTMGGAVVSRSGGRVWFCREAGRAPLARIELAPGAEAIWDGRFVVRNTGARAIDIAQSGLTRSQAETLLQRALDAPAAAIRTAPLVTRPGEVVAIGASVLGRGVDVAIVPPSWAENERPGN